jgi:hypothetical protein
MARHDLDVYIHVRWSGYVDRYFFHAGRTEEDARQETERPIPMVTFTTTSSHSKLVHRFKIWFLKRAYCKYLRKQQPQASIEPYTVRKEC